jgi:hypothetical protein
VVTTMRCSDEPRPVLLETVISTGVRGVRCLDL